jgi:hypothetical protein
MKKVTFLVIADHSIINGSMVIDNTSPLEGIILQLEGY